MSQELTTSAGVTTTVNNNTKDEDKNKAPRSGLMSQSAKLLTTTETVGAVAMVSKSAPPPPAPSTSSSSQPPPPAPSTSSSSQPTKKSEPEKVESLELTLSSSKLSKEFRTFLRTKVDQNKSDNPDSKKMTEQWLDFILLLDELRELPESQLEAKSEIIIRIGQKFLGKPPDGYNMALSNQLNRKEVINHAKSLSEKVPGLKPDEKLLDVGYEYIYGKLEQKHDVFKKSFNKTTTLAAFLCALL